MARNIEPGHNLEQLIQRAAVKVRSFRDDHNGRIPTFEDLSRYWMDDKSYCRPPDNPFTGNCHLVSLRSADSSGGWAYDETTGEIAIIVPRKLAQGKNLPTKCLIVP